MTAETRPWATAVRGAVPNTSTVPASGRDSPSTMSMVVVLPAPLGPRKATISPGSTVRSRPSTAVTGPKRLVSPRRATAGTGPIGDDPRRGSGRCGKAHAEIIGQPAAADPSSTDHDSPMTGVTDVSPITLGRLGTLQLPSGCSHLRNARNAMAFHVAEQARHDDRVLGTKHVVSAVIIPFLVLAFVVLWGWPRDTGRLFAWPIKPPLTALLLGAVYLGGAYFFARAVRAARWHTIKAGFPPVATFATLMGIATILHGASSPTPTSPSGGGSPSTSRRRSSSPVWVSTVGEDRAPVGSSCPSRWPASSAASGCSPSR